jgi:hypothetical protein
MTPLGPMLFHGFSQPVGGAYLHLANIYLVLQWIGLQMFFIQIKKKNINE